MRPVKIETVLRLKGQARRSNSLEVFLVVRNLIPKIVCRRLTKIEWA